MAKIGSTMDAEVLGGVFNNLSNALDVKDRTRIESSLKKRTKSAISLGRRRKTAIQPQSLFPKFYEQNEDRIAWGSNIGQPKKNT